jgi:hypothetical protein
MLLLAAMKHKNNGKMVKVKLSLCLTKYHAMKTYPKLNKCHAMRTHEGD